MSSKSVPRDKIPWYPTIDEEKCTGCRECFEFCKNEVFEWDDEKNCPKVVNPLNCVVGCSACMNLCSQDAISFPKIQDIRQIIRELREHEPTN